MLLPPFINNISDFSSRPPSHPSSSHLTPGGGGSYRRPYQPRLTSHARQESSLSAAAAAGDSSDYTSVLGEAAGGVMNSSTEPIYHTLEPPHHDAR